MVLAITLTAAACSGTNGVTDPVTTVQRFDVTPGLGPVDRTVAVVTTGCGSAAAAIGSAVRLDDTTVLTAAHLIAGAGDVAVVEQPDLPPNREWPAFSPGTLFSESDVATVVAFDPGRDLALVETDGKRADGPEYQRPDFGTAAVGDAVEIHGAATVSIEGSVAQSATIEADEVRGRSRVMRDGYRLDASTGRGDSGAGVWSTDGRLVGLVFAVSSDDRNRTWAVSGREIITFLDAAEERPAPSYRCDEATSRLVVGP